jgi:hypothetical protein
MADGAVATQAVDDGLFGKMLADKAKPALGIELLSVKRNDTRRFLTAMLKRMEAKNSKCGCILVIEDSENTTFFVKPIVVKSISEKTGFREFDRIRVHFFHLAVFPKQQENFLSFFTRNFSEYQLSYFGSNIIMRAKAEFIEESR